MTDLSNINWERIISLYNTIKYLYAECEETDPDLCTNLQPLNEFRAALDHLFRIVAIGHLEEYKDKNAEKEADKLYGHLRRAYFDVCDLLSSNYRYRISEMLSEYSRNTIQTALPEYYPTMKPQLEKSSTIIADLRTSRIDEYGEEKVAELYTEIVVQFRDYYTKIVAALPSLDELERKAEEEQRKEHKRNIVPLYVIPIAAIVVDGHTVSRT